MGEEAAKKAKVENLGTLTYFPLLAKGLAPALCAELSGISWKGSKDVGFSFEYWGQHKDEIKAKTPFGQLPMLETPEGMVIGQSIAICNYIGRVAGTEGANPAEFAMSQMLLAEGEDIYALMQKYQPTQFVKSKAEDNSKFWAEVLPDHMKKLEALLKQLGLPSWYKISAGVLGVQAKLGTRQPDRQTVT